MKKSLRGFTIIEVVIYLALFGILIGGAVVSTYNIFESESRGQTHALLQEDGDFILGKIEWALSGAQAVTAPQATYPGTLGNSVTIDKWDATVGNPIVLALGGGAGFDLIMSTSSQPTGMTINNSNVRVSGLYFYHTQASGDGINPETVAFSFVVSALTPNGMLLSEQFPTTTVALRH